jgi:hypothetical protein
MTNPESIQPANLRPTFSAEESAWQDLSRISAFIFSLGFGFIISTIYLIFFLYFLSNKYTLMNRNPAVLILIAGFLILISPILLEFIFLRIVSGMSKKFTKSFYNISDEAEGVNVGRLIQRRVFGVPPMPGFLGSFISYPFIVVDKDKLEDKFSWAYSLGGPAKLIIYDGFAVYLERGGKFSRVVGSGIAFLERYETLRDIIDLRPQIKDIQISAWSKDGIKVNVHVHLECQILSALDAESSRRMDTSQEPGKRVYPFNDQAVQAAVETASVRLDKDKQPEKYDWVAGVCGNIEGQIRMHVYGNTINDLLRGELDQQTFPNVGKQSFQETDNGKPSTQLLSIELRDLIQTRVNKDNERLGARLINLQVTKVDKSGIVDHQWIENWEAEWKSINTITAGETTAYRIRIQEKAHAEAQKDMILAIAESLEKMDAEKMREPLLLSLSGMLENSLVDPYVRAALPKEAMETLEKLQSFLQEKK